MLENMTVPKHVAVILDGNGRWANMGISYFTVYGFSTENWKRSAEEVGALMKLFRYYMVRLLKIANENNVRVKMIGDKYRFAPDIIEGIDNLTEGTRNNRTWHPLMRACLPDTWIPQAFRTRI